MVRSLALATALLLATPAHAKKPKPAPAPEPEPAAEEAAPEAAPAPEATEATEAPEEAEAIVHNEIPPLHIPADTLAEWLPDDHAGLVELQGLYAAFTEDSLGQDEQKNLTILTEEKPAELGALQDKAMAIVRAGEGNNPSAAAFVLASAMLAYADLAYSMRPTERMKPKQAEKFWEILETEIWPSFAGVDADARDYLVSIEAGAKADSPFKQHAADLIAAMEAAGRGERPPPPPEPEATPEEAATEPAPEAPAPE